MVLLADFVPLGRQVIGYNVVLSPESPRAMLTLRMGSLGEKSCGVQELGDFLVHFVFFMPLCSPQHQFYWPPALTHYTIIASPSVLYLSVPMSEASPSHRPFRICLQNMAPFQLLHKRVGQY